MSFQIDPLMSPEPGERLARFVGDRLRFTLADRAGRAVPAGWTARLRTNLGRAAARRREIVDAHTAQLPAAGASWHDLPMRPEGAAWTLELALTEVGYFQAKPYFLDPQGWQHWPAGTDTGIAVHPDRHRTANTIYCAFTRMFGPSRTARDTTAPALVEPIAELDAAGYTVIPPSGRFRDLIAQLPHIVDTLGCRILHLLPVGPTPTTYARFGRFGSPYASLDLTAIDPALVEFDRRTTGVEQFEELARATHARGARLFLDIVINHTGWGSTLEENHPEWFRRGPDGRFASPGAWGTTWEDLVELEPEHVPLWDQVAESFLVWCRRGVDGFRCDAGYKVPLPVWQYITARVHTEFPDAVFLLEGLGGAWELTEALLTEGGMQWAYSELFQNYSPTELAGYLDHTWNQSRRVGLLVHYSETHDNDRLARRGRDWALLRHRLCALASDHGGFGFTGGGEWLAPERVNVHSSRGLAWDNPDNLVPELARLNRLLAEHPAFFDGARSTRLTEFGAPGLAWRRDAENGVDAVWVLVNSDPGAVQTVTLPAAEAAALADAAVDLLGQPGPASRPDPAGGVVFTLAPAAVYCLAPVAPDRGAAGEAYRQARARAAWGLQALAELLPVTAIPEIPWRELAAWVGADPAGFLTAASALAAAPREPGAPAPTLARGAETSRAYPPVVHWDQADRGRIVPVPPGHWVLIRDAGPFRATLEAGSPARVRRWEALAIDGGWLAVLPPDQPRGDARLSLERYGPGEATVGGGLRFLAAGPRGARPGRRPLELQPAAAGATGRPRPDDLDPRDRRGVLLTNGRGGMARLAVDFGAIFSKYDCLLGANLHARVPVDRHVFAKRARAWVNADGFISPLDARNLTAFAPGPPAVWRFAANAGDGRIVEVELTAAMEADANTTALRFARPAAGAAPDRRALPAGCDVRLTVRVDIEDRNFHSETRRNPGADHHFSTHTHALGGAAGFAFTPAPDRQLRVTASAGRYHPAPEWCEGVGHPIEAGRGQPGAGDAYSPGWFELPLAAGAEVGLTVTAEPAGVAPAPPTATPETPDEDEFTAQLRRAAAAYVVRRDAGVTVIAGYPWFLDWGRDSLICARGLLAAGWRREVTELLVTFGRFVKDGTLPNTIHGDDASNRDTSDAPLWYGVVCEEAAGGDPTFYQTPAGTGGATLSDVLANIANNYLAGTPNGIRVDPDSGLVWSPSHFTWMDTNHPAGTPREGYPVEIQVLWIRLLRQLARVRPAAETAYWTELATRAEAAWHRYFWRAELGWPADALLAPARRPAADAVVDTALRSNGLLAVSLGLLTGEPARRCVAAAARYLVVPGGLRSLAPLPVAVPLPVRGGDGRLLNDPANPYWGHYEGDEDTRRKPAYHNGTAWGWTYPGFCEALVRAWDFDPAAVAAARAYLGANERLLLAACVGQLPEIMDGDAPHTPRGCDAQAWTVTETLRVWRWLDGLGPTG